MAPAATNPSIASWEVPGAGLKLNVSPAEVGPAIKAEMTRAAGAKRGRRILLRIASVIFSLDHRRPEPRDARKIFGSR
jgi:hypothetical protein